MTDELDWAGKRCGHNFEPAQCPYKRCAYREAIAEVERLANSWRCFHCGAVFTDAALASEHFGDREDAQPAACERMLNAIAETFEQYGIHRNRHNAASVRLLAQQRDAALSEVERLRAVEAELRKDAERLDMLYELAVVTKDGRIRVEIPLPPASWDGTSCLWDRIVWNAAIDEELGKGEVK